MPMRLLPLLAVVSLAALPCGLQAHESSAPPIPLQQTSVAQSQEPAVTTTVQPQEAPAVQSQEPPVAQPQVNPSLSVNAAQIEPLSQEQLQYLQDPAHLRSEIEKWDLFFEDSPGNRNKLAAYFPEFQEIQQAANQIQPGQGPDNLPMRFQTWEKKVLDHLYRQDRSKTRNRREFNLSINGMVNEYAEVERLNQQSIACKGDIACNNEHFDGSGRTPEDVAAPVPAASPQAPQSATTISKQTLAAPEVQPLANTVASTPPPFPSSIPRVHFAGTDSGIIGQVINTISSDTSGLFNKLLYACKKIRALNILTLAKNLTILKDVIRLTKNAEEAALTLAIAQHETPDFNSGPGNDNKNTNGTFDKGLMQINDNTAPGLIPLVRRAFGSAIANKDIHDPLTSLAFGITYLRELRNKHPDWNTSEVLAGYNGGQGGEYKWSKLIEHGDQSILLNLKPKTKAAFKRVARQIDGYVKKVEPTLREIRSFLL